MILVDVVQGSPEWFAARCGVPTASNFDKIITNDGKRSKQAEKYMYQLAAERVTGMASDSYQSPKMAQAIELEAEARSLYELATDTEVQTCGLVFKDERRLYAASPDGFVVGGCLEIKCPESWTHVGYILRNEMPEGYFQQVQGQLLVTDLAWVDFFSYYPGLKPMLVRVHRDEKFLKALETELLSFCSTLDEVTAKIR